MKILVITLMAALSAQSTFASTVLSCNSSGAGGALVKQLILSRGANSTTLKMESYAGEGLNEVKVIKTVSTPVSTKFVLEANTGAKTSLVVFKKQAVLLYEAERAADLTEDGASVEFLICK